MVRYFIIAFIAFFGCNPKVAQSHKNKGSTMRPLNYSESIIQICKKVQDLTWRFEPLTYPEFEEIYLNPKIYLDSALSFLSNSEFNDVEFGTIVLSMHKLPLDDYMLFTSKNFELLKEKQINVNQFISVINGFYGNDHFMKNKKSKIIQGFYKEILTDDLCPPELKEYIKEII